MTSQAVVLLRRVVPVLLALGAFPACEQPAVGGRRGVSGAVAGDGSSEAPGSNGRYRILDPTPQYARNTMLLDTQTGRTWLMCSTNDSTTAVTTNWCAMTFVGAPAAPPRVP